MFNILEIQNIISNKIDHPCLNCGYHKNIQLTSKILPILNKYNSGVRLLHLLEELQRVAPIIKYKKIINNINTILLELVSIHNIFPTEIWNIILQYTDDYDIIDNQLNILLTRIYQPLNSYENQNQSPIEKWKNPLVRIFCNKCKYSNSEDKCILCNLNSFVNVNGICFECDL